jgi:hypothetical protein
MNKYSFEFYFSFSVFSPFSHLSFLSSCVLSSTAHRVFFSARSVLFSAAPRAVFVSATPDSGIVPGFLGKSGYLQAGVLLRRTNGKGVQESAESTGGFP